MLFFFIFKPSFFSESAMLDLKTVILCVTFTLSLTKVKTFLLSLLLEKEKKNWLWLLDSNLQDEKVSN